MDFTISPDVEMVVRTVRDYVNEKLLPIEMEVEHEDRIPAEILREMGELGFFGLPFSEDDGGFGLGFLGYTLAMEQLGRANAAYGVLIGASSGLFGQAIALGGSPEQRARWLPGIASGETLGAFCLTEEQAGSDAYGVRTTALPVEGGYRLDGEKTWVLNGPDAGLYLIFARLGGDERAQGIAAFVVERGTPGLSTSAPDDKMGLHGVSTCAVRLAGCAVPVENRVPLPGEPDVDSRDAGLRLALHVLGRHRISIAALGVGLAGRLLESSLDFAQQRKQFGQPVASFQAVQWMLADTATEHFVAQQAVYRAAWETEQGHANGKESAMVKLFAGEMLYRAADRAMQVHGGMGYMKELWIERGYRDARAFRIFGGTSELMRAAVARELGCPD